MWLFHHSFWHSQSENGSSPISTKSTFIYIAVYLAVLYIYIMYILCLAQYNKQQQKSLYLFWNSLFFTVHSTKFNSSIAVNAQSRSAPLLTLKSACCKRGMMEVFVTVGTTSFDELIRSVTEKEFLKVRNECQSL